MIPKMISVKNGISTCIIDDDAIYVYGFKKLLSLKGLSNQINSFRNGYDAISWLKDPHNAINLPDVIFLDINMPVMDGWEFMEAFAEIKSHLGKNITIYMLSSSIDLNDIYRVKDMSGIADYIFKPVNEHQLYEIFYQLQEADEMQIYKYKP